MQKYINVITQDSHSFHPFFLLKSIGPMCESWLNVTWILCEDIYRETPISSIHCVLMTLYLGRQSPTGFTNNQNISLELTRASFLCQRIGAGTAPIPSPTRPWGKEVARRCRVGVTNLHYITVGGSFFCFNGFYYKFQSSYRRSRSNNCHEIVTTRMQPPIRSVFPTQ